jgi:CRISPR/Cas system-associated exonuclease Cas4 (RecB family)
MPPTNPIQTMIPMDLRKFFELPTPREKQGLFAHHFYRLLHQCEEMVITYSTASESINSNEESRYIMQLELELARINPHIEFVKRDYTLASDGVKAEDISIEKTPEVLSRMDELFRLGTSASAIKTYLTCPLDFYYKYILKFGEEEKVEEEVENNTFGTFIHAVLEELYTPFSRRDAQGNLKENQPPSLQVEDIERMLKQYEYLMRQKFSAHFNNDPTAFETGKNFLSFSMALELTKRFLETEKKYILSLNNQPFFIEALEERLEYELELQVAGEKRIIKLKGFVDRIDSVDGRIRILDYKSGKVDAKDVGLALSKFKGSMEEGLVKLALESKHFLQLMIYNYLYYKKYEIVPHSSAIISFVRLNESPFTMVAKDYTVTQIIESFPSVLEELLNEMYNTEKPFEHTKEFFNYCAYC